MGRAQGPLGLVHRPHQIVVITEVATREVGHTDAVPVGALGDDGEFGGDCGEVDGCHPLKLGRRASGWVFGPVGPENPPRSPKWWSVA